MADDIKRLIAQSISLNSGGFSSPEVEALRKVLLALVDKIEFLEEEVEELKLTPPGELPGDEPG